MSEDPEKDFQFDIVSEKTGERLDVLIAEALQVEKGSSEVSSRSQVRQWILEGRVRVNNQVVTKPAYRAQNADSIHVSLPNPTLSSLEAETPVGLNIIFEDEYLLVINKPSGLSVHPGAGQQRGTLANHLVGYLGDQLRQIGNALRPGIVHRLDKDTSGLMVVAKSAEAYHGLVSQLQPPRTMGRKYQLLAYGVPRVMPGSDRGQDGTSGIICLPIGRSPTNRKKMAVVPTGKAAETHWIVIEALTQAIFFEARLQTGRTHQIRVHFHATGAALIGDPLYRGNIERLSPRLRQAVMRFQRQALHAAELDFIHPVLKSRHSFRADLPSDFVSLLQEFRAH